jgi:hypothetical protein
MVTLVTRTENNNQVCRELFLSLYYAIVRKPDVDRLSDVDLAVELARKETDGERARHQNQQPAEELAAHGRRFRTFPEREVYWYQEALQFLKGRSRVIALADYSVGKVLLLAVPRRVLIGDPEPVVASAPPAPGSAVRKRRPRDSPFW